MKKTYFAPELESVKIAPVQMMAVSEKYDPNKEAENQSEGNLSKGFGGGLWETEDDTEE